MCLFCETKTENHHTFTHVVLPPSESSFPKGISSQMVAVGNKMKLKISTANTVDYTFLSE